MKKDGKLVPDGELDEPLVIRPTSETIIGESMAKWVQSYRDLPLLINQWANVSRWEMRPRILLRTAEFLWQEGHTAHETREDAVRETKQMLEVYRAFSEDVLAVPVITGEKIPAERFPGAVDTYCIEAMMQDGRALQAGTSHYLGQNFARSCNIQFQSREGTLEIAHTTSWGVSTRLLGALVMTHGDDNGMKVPPRVAPYQAVIIPILRDDGTAEHVMDYCEQLKADILSETFDGAPVRVKVDTRDIPASDKRWDWIKKGAPLVVEIGPKDIEGRKVCITRRDKLENGKRFEDRGTFIGNIGIELANIQKDMFETAKAFRTKRTTTNIKDWASFEAYFKKNDEDSFTSDQGFIRAKWCGDEASLAKLEPLGVTVRCIPFDQDGKEGTCVLTGRPATIEVIFARAY
jgi:prolyl-tRNA synthetase